MITFLASLSWARNPNGIFPPVQRGGGCACLSNLRCSLWGRRDLLRPDPFRNRGLASLCGDALRTAMRKGFWHKFVHRFKPGVSQRTHLFAAALLWSSIGSMLLLRGSLRLQGKNDLLLLLPAFLAGTLKSIFVLDKSARKGIDRILRLDDGSCLGAVYSVKTWLLVAGMMLGGILLRHSAVPQEIVGVLYAAIGWALLLSSRHGWRSWYAAGGPTSQ